MQTNAMLKHTAYRQTVERRQQRERWKRFTLQVLVFVILFGSWEFLAYYKLIDTFFFSSPLLIMEQIYDWAVNGTSQGPLYIHFEVTFVETVLSFFIGVVLGVIAGFALGRNELLAVVFGPYISMLNALPRVVLAPIFIIWFGLGMASKIASGVVLTFFIVFFNAFQGVREVDKNLLNNARLLGANQRQLTWHVIIPSALTWIFTSLQTSFGFALVGAVVGEFVGATKGLGFLIAQAQGAFDTTGVFAAMVLLSLTALAAKWAVQKLEERLVKWRYVRQ